MIEAQKASAMNLVIGVDDFAHSPRVNGSCPPFFQGWVSGSNGNIIQTINHVGKTRIFIIPYL